MSDLNSIFAILAAADKQAQASNPYAGFEGIGNDLGNIIVKSAAQRDESGDSRYGLGELIASGLLTGILGGTAQGLGRDYRAEQNSLAQQSVKDIFAGGDIFRPEGMNKDVWGAIQGPAAMVREGRTYDENDYRNKLGLQTDEYLRRAKEQIPLEVQGEIQKKQAELGLMQHMYGPLASLPPGLQDNAVQQAATAQKNAGIGDFIEEQFNKAKNIPSLEAIKPFSTGKNEMEGIGITLTTALQAALGREMNNKEQERLAAAIPDWNDTADQIELKKQRFKELMQTISPRTPLVTGMVQPSAAPSPSAAPTPTPAMGGAGAITPEMAREILKQRGVQGY